MPSVCLCSLIVCLFVLYIQAQSAYFMMENGFIWIDVNGEKRKKMDIWWRKMKMGVQPTRSLHIWGMFQEHSQNIKFEFYTMESMHSHVSLCVFDCPLNGVKFYCSDFQCVLGMLREHRKSMSFLFLSSICTLYDTLTVMYVFWMNDLWTGFVLTVCSESILSLFHSLCLHVLTYCLFVCVLYSGTDGVVYNEENIYLDG